MGTVEVTIKIPEYMFEDIQDRYKHPNKGDGINLLEDVIANGTVLPKGHGRLVDAEKIAREVNRAWTLWEKKGEDCYLFADVLTPMLISQPTVIEADKDGDADG